MSTKTNIERTNQQIRERLVNGRGRKVIVKLDDKAKELMGMRPGESFKRGGHGKKTS